MILIRFFQQNIQPKIRKWLRIDRQNPVLSVLMTPRHLCTASEVATMDYARTVLGLPISKCSAASGVRLQQNGCWS